MQKRIKVFVTVSNDLATDNRVLKVCQTLYDRGYLPHLVGRQMSTSIDMPQLPFPYTRMRLIFNRGPLFYAELNLRLFFFLLFGKAQRIHANDLDTLLPAWLVARLLRRELVYDTHEYFLGVPEIQNRKLVKKVWKTIESTIFPKLHSVITVNDSIAKLYEKEYGVKLVVMRNIPLRFPGKISPVSRDDLGVYESDFLLILQGAGINVDRGAEEAVHMMSYLEGCRLIIAGSGDVIDSLKKISQDEGIRGKVIFLPKMNYSELIRVTACCNLGLTLDKDTNINYRFSLPNKLFDYVHAGVPVFASNLPEVSKIIEQYGVGIITPDHNPEKMAALVNDLRNNEELLKQMKQACAQATLTLNWQTEAGILSLFYPTV